MPNLGVGELLVILAIILLLFGGKKLPELSRSLGEGVRELRLGLKGGSDKPDEAAKRKAK